MSEKKTTGKRVHTLTLEDQSKLARENAKKMEQGKVCLLYTSRCV